MEELRDFVPQTLRGETDRWWAEYGLIDCGWIDTPAPEERHAPRAFAQQDPRWASQLMGGVNQTVGAYGCAMVCACMVYSQHNAEITPREFNATLNSNAGYNIIGGSEAHLAWDRLPAIFPRLEWKGRQDWRRLLYDSDLELLRAKIAVAPLILWVDFRPYVTGMQSHFVLAVDHSANDIEILDPWGGIRAGLLERYGRGAADTLRHAVWGYRELGVEWVDGRR